MRAEDIAPAGHDPFGRLDDERAELAPRAIVHDESEANRRTRDEIDESLQSLGRD